MDDIYICPDGEASMMYVGREPWHGLGQKLDAPATAAQAIHAAHLDWEVMKRPVYLEIPRDMVEAPIDSPAADATLELNTDDGAVAEAVAEIAERLSAADRPVLIVGVEVHRSSFAIRWCGSPSAWACRSRHRSSAAGCFPPATCSLPAPTWAWCRRSHCATSSKPPTACCCWAS